MENWIDNFEQYSNTFPTYHFEELETDAIIKQSINEIILVHEYAFDGTLCQYVKQNFNKINWNDKLRLAKQIISAVKCLHENDLIHLNLNENNDLPMSEMEISNSTELLNYYTNLHNKTTKELMLISSIIKILSENSMINDQNDLLNLTSSLSTLNIVETIPISLVNASNQNHIDIQFLYDLNKLFITQFNIQGATKNSVGSVICCLKKHIVEHNKNSEDILEHYNNYKFKYYFTSIIGFFYEYGIGTIVDYHKAFDMYRQATENFNTSTKVDNLLKENQIIGLISLGLLYIYGKGVIADQRKGLYSFLKSTAKGSISGKYYIGQCYDNGYGVIKRNNLRNYGI
ncbi:12683_t:CDS:2 [Cetraspora pellucida]|uniref:12683_t:CDS:1 n=1 Tax=Cetraspora pellucida TaxID=1433469 RepID=A0A9N9HN29_9GLOM|nr:12683_t:CDS:2 [Cetraspora pellucida]